MLKNKKRGKPKKKKLENQSAKFFEKEMENRDANELEKQLKTAIEGLYFMSETDAEILTFNGKPAQTVSAAEILIQTESSKNTAVEEKSFAEFFSRLTEIQDWFGEEEKLTAQKFTELKNLLENNLNELKVFKLGKIQLDVYVVGLDSENKLMGIKTKAVET